MAILPVGAALPSSAIDLPDDLAGGGGVGAAPPDGAVFDQAMQAAASRPESEITSVAHDMSAGFQHMLADIPASASAVSDPAQMVQLQNELMQSYASADITSKVAGGVAQSINKLTTMQ